jgi:hypothetical protein
MADTCWESVKAEGSAVLDKLRDLLHEGNVRRVRVRHNGRTIAEFPLTAGVVGAVFAPGLAAIGAIIAIMKDCSIEVEREAAAPAVTTAVTTTASGDSTAA